MIRVIIAEDMHMVRGALVALLNVEPDIEVVAEMSSGDEILPAATKHRPDVALLDIDLPGKDGLTAAGEIRAALPEVRTLILTGLGRPGTLRRHCPRTSAASRRRTHRPANWPTRSAVWPRAGA